MKRKTSKIKGIFLLFVLLNLSLVGQELKITTNIPDNLNPGQTYETEVYIDKGAVSSFAKFQMDLPFGFTATSVDPKNGNWTFDQQRVKIVWVSVPSDQQFTVKFKMTVPPNALNTSIITGKFFYLENNVKKEYEMPPVNVKISSGGAVTTNTVVTTETNTVVTTPTTTTVAATNTTVTTPTVATTPTVTTTSTNPSTNPNLVTYRVQIGAFSARPAKGKFPGVKDFWIYEDNGLYKATAGIFKTLNEAEAYKAQLRSQGMDGFVVAFQNGIRVKLQ